MTAQAHTNGDCLPGCEYCREELMREAEALIGPIRGPGTDLVPAGEVSPARREQARAALASPKMREILDSMAGYVAGQVDDAE